MLSKGPTDEDRQKQNIETKELQLETLKMGDIFPSYHISKFITLDVEFVAESPVELISLRIGDLNDAIPVIIKLN